jgi:hypothetical protein
MSDAARQDLIAAARLGADFGAAVVDLPTDHALAVVEGCLGAIDSVREALGLDVLGYGNRPPRALLRASWRALDPRLERRKARARA